jgi:hypothetical protein
MAVDLGGDVGCSIEWHSIERLDREKASPQMVKSLSRVPK